MLPWLLGKHTAFDFFSPTWTHFYAVTQAVVLSSLARTKNKALSDLRLTWIFGGLPRLIVLVQEWIKQCLTSVVVDSMPYNKKLLPGKRQELIRVSRNKDVDVFYIRAAR